MSSIEHTFNVPPFPAFPSASRYVPIGSLDEALIRMGRSIETCETISLMIGPPGTGKSLACQLLAQRFQATRQVVVLGDTPIEDRAALLRHVLHHLGANHAAGPANDLHLALVDHVSGNDKLGLLLLVDEAQTLSCEVMEAIRMTTNIMHAGQPKVSAILCGGPKLDEILVDPSMEAFTQRVATRCYLHPMSGEETQQYISHTIAACGADPQTTITGEAISAIHHGCNGIPRLVNQLMTLAIDVAEERDQALIDETVIDHAWAMLQQLPSPVTEEPKVADCSENQNSTVEFGALSALGEPSDSDCQASNDHETERVTNEAADPQPQIQLATSGANWIDEQSSDQETIHPTNSEHDSHEELSVAPIEIATIANTEELFGAFEAEEDVMVGAAIAEARVDMISTAKDVIQCCSGENPLSGQGCSAGSGSDLESMLHQEIVAMTTTDESATIVPDMPETSRPSAMASPLSCETTPCDTSPNAPEHGELDHVCMERDEERERMIHSNGAGIDFVQEELDSSPASVNRGAMDFVADSTRRPLADAFQNGPSPDDRDLLIIEDEMSLRIAEPKECHQRNSSKIDEQESAQSVTVDFQSMLSRMRTGS